MMMSQLVTSLGLPVTIGVQLGDADPTNIVLLLGKTCFAFLVELRECLASILPNRWHIVALHEFLVGSQILHTFTAPSVWLGVEQHN